MARDMYPPPGPVLMARDVYPVPDSVGLESDTCGVTLRISEYGGEQAIINLIAANYGIRSGDDLPLGIGDDAALIKVCEDRLLIVTTDLLMENTHFRRDIIDAYSLGWKSVAVNISDIAAMAGKPTYTFVSFALDDVDVTYVEEMYDGMRDCAARYGSAIAGGDTNVSKDLWALNITQLGDVQIGHAVLRSGARPGDAILVTGSLGGSRAGLEFLFREGLEEALIHYPVETTAHLRPKPRVAEALAAAGTGKLHAMMDISDGLAADLPKLCAASGVGAVVREESVPVNDSLLKAATDLGIDPASLAIQGGEDYELLIAVAESDVDHVSKVVVDATGTPVTALGSVTEEKEVILESEAGTRAPLRGGWEHFRKTE